MNAREVGHSGETVKIWHLCVAREDYFFHVCQLADLLHGCGVDRAFGNLDLCTGIRLQKFLRILHHLIADGSAVQPDVYISSAVSVVILHGRVAADCEFYRRDHESDDRDNCEHSPEAALLFGGRGCGGGCGGGGGLRPGLYRRVLHLLPLAAQGAGGGGGCHREGGGVLFVIAGPVVPAGGADGGCVVLLVTYRAFPHEGPPLLFAGGFIPPPGGLAGVLGHAPAVGIAVRQG